MEIVNEKPRGRKRKSGLAPSMKGPLSVQQAAFKAYWLKWGMSLFNRAHAVGVEWEKVKPWELSAMVLLYEEAAKPDEFKNNPFQEARNTQKPAYR